MQNEIEKYFDRLWPINRSLTGNGNRQTLSILGEIADLEIFETPSGTPCFDWNVPPEWNVREAWVKDASGNKIIDFGLNNLHLLGYSEPFNGKLHFNELKAHLYSKPEMPHVIPYLTSYYKRRWGFCISHNQLLNLNPNAEYEVYIDSNLNEAGSMTWGEAVLPGKSEKEIFFSTYICHPSMASDVLSGMLCTAFLYRELKKNPDHHYTYRFLFIPETIGSINYLSQRHDALKKNMLAGYVLTCLGDDGAYTYKRSRMGNSIADRMAERLLKNENVDCIIENFWPGGSDERQFCSPGFNLPVGSLMRTRYEVFPQYHTSDDNKNYISFEAMEAGVNMYMKLVNLFETNPVFISTNPHCEPQLGKRGLYPTLGAQQKYPEYIDAMMWLLNLADGTHDLVSISNESGMRIELLQEIAIELENQKLIVRS